VPSNQEWAVVLWTGVALVCILCNPDLRGGLFRVLRSFLHEKVLIAFLLAVAWIAGEVALGDRLNLWTSTDASESSLWFLTSAVVMIINLTGASTTEHFFRKSVRRLFTTSAVLTVFVYFFALPLLVSIVLMPVEALLVGVSVVATESKDSEPSRKLADGLLCIIAIGLVVHGIVRLALGWDTLDKLGLVRSLALPTWLTIGLLPMVYLLGLYAEFEVEFVLLKTESYSRQFRWKYAFALASVFTLRAHALEESASDIHTRLDESMRMTEIRDLMRDTRNRALANRSNARDSTEMNETSERVSEGMTGPIGRAMRTVLSLALRQQDEIEHFEVRDESPP
jgi:hypothetical protein